MSRTPKKASKAKTAATGNQPPTRHRDTAGDVLLPLLGAPLELVGVDGTGTPLRPLPCDENGNESSRSWATRTRPWPLATPPTSPQPLKGPP